MTLAWAPWRGATTPRPPTRSMRSSGPTSPTRTAATGSRCSTTASTAGTNPRTTRCRLTLLHTPATKGGYAYQNKQDFGHHTFTYSIVGHAGDYRAGGAVRKAEVLNQPLRAFVAPRHGGVLGRSFSLGRLAEPQCGAAGAQTGRGFGRICGSFLRDLGARVAAGRGELRGSDRRRPGAQRRGGRRGRRGVQRPRAALRGPGPSA